MSFRRSFLTVFKKELLELLRDRRALFFLLAPPFILPGMALCGGVFIGVQAAGWLTQGFHVAVARPEAAPALVDELAQSASLHVVDSPVQGEAASEWGDVMVLLTMPEDFQERIANDETAYITLTTRDGTWTTGLAAAAVRSAVQRYGSKLRDERLNARGLSQDWLTPVIIGEEQAPTEGVAQPVAVGGGGGDNSLGALFLPLAVTSWLVGGGMGLIIDTTVGEKERRTMEALLLTPASRLGIVAGKLAVVFVASMAVMSLWLIEGIVLSVIGTAGPAFMAVGEGTLNLGEVLAQSTGQVLTLIFYLILLLLPFIVTLNSLMMAWSTFAASYRESNMILFLLQLALPILVIISVFSLPANVSLGWYLTPMMGVIIAIRDLFTGVLVPVDLVAAVTGGMVWATLSLLLAAYIYSREWALVRGL